MHRKYYGIIAALLLPAFSYAAVAAAGKSSEYFDPVAPVIFWVTIIFFFGVIGRDIAQRLGQPGVLGELLMGVLLGNVCYYLGIQLAIILREGPAVFDIVPSMLAGSSLQAAVQKSIHAPAYAQQVLTALQSTQGIGLVKTAYALDVLSRYGVIFLLFMVGLESSVDELKHTGRESIQVAILGVVAPILLGLIVMIILMPAASFKRDLFVAATLSATSVGITARVLKEMRKLQTREARTILGAAMLDDILGLIILAIVSSIVVRDELDIMETSQIIVSSILFFSTSLLIGPWILRQSAKYFRFVDLWEAKLIISFVFVMTLAWLATLVQLATIIGAFAAGIIIHDGFFGNESEQKRTLSIKELVAPFESILVPLFFMLIGIQIKIELFFDWHVLGVAGGLIVVAVLGKLLSGLGGNRHDDRLLIGVGMIPRGEVGLVFASIGRTLGVVSDQLFSAIVLMVIVTTLIVPPWLKSRYENHKATT